MLMYGKEASNRKQEIDRQRHTNYFFYDIFHLASIKRTSWIIFSFGVEKLFLIQSEIIERQP